MNDSRSADPFDDSQSAEQFLESVREAPAVPRPVPLWKRQTKRTVIIGAVVAVAIAAVALFVVTRPGPEDLVRDYLESLASKDAETALEYASEADDFEETPDGLLVDEAMSGDWEVTSLTRRHLASSSNATVDVTITAADKTERSGRFHLNVDNGEWVIDNPLVRLDLASLPMRFADLNGTVVRPGNNGPGSTDPLGMQKSEPVWVFPGAYEIYRKSSGLIELSEPTYVAVPGGPGPDEEGFATQPFMPTVTAGDDLAAELNRQLADWLDECAGSTSASPDGCPFAAGDEQDTTVHLADGGEYEATEVTWKIKTYPTIEAIQGVGTFAARELAPGVVTVKGKGIPETGSGTKKFSGDCGIQLNEIHFELIKPETFEFYLPDPTAGTDSTCTKRHQ
ncbi:MAG: hypothetical protein ACRD0P_00845 [Stackebrandtia sp.]